LTIKVPSVSPRSRLPLTIEHVLLGFLSQQPMHGYEIGQRLAAPSGLGLIWRVKQSQIYALLDRLEAEGYVWATLEPQASRPPRKVLQLTDRGRGTYLSWISSPVLHGRDMRLDFLAKLFFALRAGPTQVSGLIGAQRAVCRQRLAALETRAGAATEGEHYDWLVFRFRSGQIEETLKWLDLCERTLTGGPASQCAGLQADPRRG
jgi:PadR family transcriptional regulator AphA